MTLRKMNNLARAQSFNDRFDAGNHHEESSAYAGHANAQPVSGQYLIGLHRH